MWGQCHCRQMMQSCRGTNTSLLVEPREGYATCEACLASAWEDSNLNAVYSTAVCTSMSVAHTAGTRTLPQAGHAEHKATVPHIVRHYFITYIQDDSRICTAGRIRLRLGSCKPFPFRAAQWHSFFSSHSALGRCMNALKRRILCKLKERRRVCPR